MPSPTITTAPQRKDGGGYLLVNSIPESIGKPSGKPPYRVPTMAEIRSLPWNGLTAVSTFSGAGGSSLGYRMAGFRVAWASEFVPAARETYSENFPNTTIDSRDIRGVEPRDILEATGLRQGELDVFDGSPPCASFSTSGKREKAWGKVKSYSDTSQRSDDLFFEYARLLRGLRPKAFIAENVSGLVKGTAKGYFLEILGALKNCGYRVKAKLLDAQWLGVPQARQRLIFVGFREDLGINPVHPAPFSYRYSVRDALAHLDDSKRITYHQYCQGDLATGANQQRFKVEPRGARPVESRRFSISEIKRLCSFPDDFILTGTYAQQWERCGRAVPPLMMRAIASTVASKLQ